MDTAHGSNISETDEHVRNTDDEDMDWPRGFVQFLRSDRKDGRGGDQRGSMVSGGVAHLYHRM